MSRLKLWLPSLLWAVVISVLSTASFGSAHTEPIVEGLLHRLLPFASAATLDLLHLLLRKGAHFCEYFIFSLLLLRSVRGAQSGWRPRWALAAVAIAAAYAALDETHQIFVPGREASPWDSALDTVGAATAQLAVWLGTAKRPRLDLQGKMRQE